MFLVYVPVVSVILYFCATKCVPASARLMISRVVYHVVVAVALTLAKTVRYMAALRSAYMWDKRMWLARPLVTVFDTLLKVDKMQMQLNTSSGHGSIIIRNAISTVNGLDYDVTQVLNAIWDYGNGLRIHVPINIVLECLKLTGLNHDTNVTTRVRYSGHSNISKRYSSETFSAKYVCKLSEVFRFPPYASSEEIRRGFGVPRIIRANFVKENGSMLYGDEARESSGLRHNFYEDVDDDPCLEKNVVTLFHRFSRFQEEMPIVVTTSKSNSKIFCNSKVPS